MSPIHSLKPKSYCEQIKAGTRASCCELSSHIPLEARGERISRHQQPISSHLMDTKFGPWKISFPSTLVRTHEGDSVVCAIQQVLHICSVLSRPIAQVGHTRGYDQGRYIESQTRDWRNRLMRTPLSRQRNEGSRLIQPSVL